MALAIRKTSQTIGTAVYDLDNIRTNLEQRLGLRELVGDARYLMIDLIKKYLSGRGAKEIEENYVLYGLPKDKKIRDTVDKIASEVGKKDKDAIVIFDEITLGLGKLAKEGKLLTS